MFKSKFQKTSDLFTSFSFLLFLSFLSACGGGGDTAPPPLSVATDTTPPVITITGDNPFSLTQGETYNDEGATATDAVDGNVTVSSSGSVDTNVVGSYTITYSASDAAGNSTSADRIVDVNEAPDVSAPTLSEVSPENNAEAVDLNASIEFTFSEEIDPTSFNADTVSISTENYGTVTGTFSTDGATGTFEPSDNIPSLSRVTISITGVKDLSGNTQVGTEMSYFYSKVDTSKWYRLSNLFTGKETLLRLDNDTCAMDVINNVNDLWQFREYNGRYTLENIDRGDRKRLEGGSLGGNCLLTGMFGDGADIPFSGQTWNITPIPDTEYFRLTNDDAGLQALDHGVLQTTDNFSGQFWNFEEWRIVLASGAVGESNGGSDFYLNCERSNQVSQTNITSGDNIDAIDITCARPDGTTFTGGSTGGNGGSVSFEGVCPVGALFVGYRGTSFENSYIDQLGIMCRWPWHGEQAHLDLQGVQQTGGDRYNEAMCLSPWKPTGVFGRSGTLIDKIQMECVPPESTSSVATIIGGDGGEAFALSCPLGTAAVGFRGRAGDDIDQFRLVCRDNSAQLSETTSVGSDSSGDSLGETQVCGNTEVLTGFNLLLRGSGSSARIDQMASVCIAPGVEFYAKAYAGSQQSSNIAGYFGCPSGMFVSGVEGRFGTLLDQIAVRCSSL